jgi:hypothetical protein
LNQRIGLRVKLVLNLLLLSSKNSKNKPSMTRVPQPLSLESKSHGLEKKGSKELWHGSLKISKLVQKFKNPFFRNNILEKMVKQITFPK